MKRILYIVFLILFSLQLKAQTVTVNGNKFNVNGQQIFFNGINTAWQPQSDWSLNFLGRNFDYNWWNNEFQRYVNNHINLTRVWVHGSGNYSPSMNGSGVVTGASSQFWADMDNLVSIARAKKVYIMPTFWSFDMVKSDAGWSTYYNQFRQIINDPNKTQWYIDYFLKPFLQRYENEPYVMGYDICNEPEHMWRDGNCGNLNRNNVVRFVAMVSAAINQNSSKPCTVGSMWIIFNSNKYTGTWETYMGNNWSNSSLQAQYNNSNARLDFWSPHWYAWQNNDAPFTKTVGEWMDDGTRPTLIGETYGGNISSGVPSNNCCWNVTMANYYLQSYWNGYAGVCGWKNPHEDDGEGTFNGVASGTNAFYNNYPNLVYPTGGTTTYFPVPGTFGAEQYSNMSGVQTETTLDSGGGLDVGWIDTNDWMTYNINVASAGNYTVSYRIASPSGGAIRLEKAGGGATYGTINVPATGGYQTWATISHTVSLPAGQQQIAVVATTGGWNFNWVSITAASAATTTVQAESYTNMSGVVKETCSEGGQNVGAIETNDWMTFNNINIPASGVYTIEYRVASLNGGGQLRFEKAGTTTSYGTINIPSTGGWQNWTTIKHNVTLTAGVQNFGIKALASGWNINWWAFTPGYKSATVDVQEFDSEQEFVVYPNPVSDQLTISFPEKSEANTLSIYTVSGKRLLQKTINSNESISLKSNGIEKGIYLLTVETATKIYNSKLVVE